MAQSASQHAQPGSFGGVIASGGPDAVDRYFELSLFGLLATGFLTLAATDRMDLFSMTVTGLALIGKAALLWQGSSFLLSSAWVRRLAVAYISFFFLDILFLELSAVNE